MRIIKDLFHIYFFITYNFLNINKKYKHKDNNILNFITNCFYSNIINRNI